MVQWQEAWSTETGIDTVKNLFRTTYGQEPAGVWASPGRVNLIGEHTDYNGGLCLPIALPHRTYVAASPRTDTAVRMTTDLADGQVWESQLSDIAPGKVKGWVAYCAGPLWAIAEDGIPLTGMDIAIASCVPLGAGLSSSAAVECAVALAATDLAGRPHDRDDATRAHLANLCVRAENEVAGAPTGGMDQAASLRTQEGHAILLDCLDGHIDLVHVDLAASGLELIVIDTKASHSLDDGQYGARRASCEAACEILGISTLREIADAPTQEQDDALARLTDEVMQRRVRHVLTEIVRVRDFVASAQANNWAEAGQLMNASHASLRDDYEVSCEELDVAVDAAQKAGALGARMTGGGFGGSAIALARHEDTEKITEAVLSEVKAKNLPTPVFQLATPSTPGGRLDLSC
ncbi:MAG: galactokinase [Actinomycetaceae bacterium]|nr:galactokinase [Actinomycetaceae bacterium]